MGVRIWSNRRNDWQLGRQRKDGLVSDFATFSFHILVLAVPSDWGKVNGLHKLFSNEMAYHRHLEGKRIASKDVLFVLEVNLSIDLYKPVQ